MPCSRATDRPRRCTTRRAARSLGWKRASQASPRRSLRVVRFRTTGAIDGREPMPGDGCRVCRETRASGNAYVNFSVARDGVGLAENPTVAQGVGVFEALHADRPW